MSFDCMLFGIATMTGRIEDDFISVNDYVRIPLDELRFEFQRSPGPGGQNVNKVNTQATLLFDVANSPSLTDRDRARIRRSLATRINRDGILRIIARRSRTQSANRRDATERFALLLADALTPRKARIATRPTRASQKRRLNEKTRRSQTKQLRRGANRDMD